MYSNSFTPNDLYIEQLLTSSTLYDQVHYNFGLRNILSLLRTFGAVKRRSPNKTELTIQMRVFRDMNLSKLVEQDEPLFLSLINDLFPGIDLDMGGYLGLGGAIRNHAEEAKLVNHPSWVLKLIQLCESRECATE